MNTKLIKLLTVLCILLLACIAGEWFYAKQVQKTTLAALKVIDKKPPKMVDMPTIALTQKPEQSFVDMVERPLFIKGRRPVPESPDDLKLAAAKPSGPFNWQLNGVYGKGANLHALLSRSVKAAKGNFLKIMKGADVDGWTLAEVQKDKVILSQAGMTKELLLRKPKPKRGNPNIAAEANPDGSPKGEGAQAPPPVDTPNQQMAAPLPNGEGMSTPEAQAAQAQADAEAAAAQAEAEAQAAADAAMPNPEDGSMPDVEPIPEPDAEPIPEPEPDFQPEFDNGTNEQF